MRNIITIAILAALCACTPATTQQPVRFGAAPPSTAGFVTPVTDADHGSLATGSGYVLNIHCVLTVLSSTPPLYVMGFDSSSSSQPSNSTVPTAGMVSGGLTVVGNDVTYNDGSAHATVRFVNGFLLALSTTADTFTAPSAGNQMRCDAKLLASP